MRGDVVGLGLTGAGHALLGAAVRLAATGGVVLTGRLSMRRRGGWPGMGWRFGGGAGDGLVEMVVRAGVEVGAGLLEELYVRGAVGGA